MSKLTSRTLASGATLGDLIHIVITGDTSQDPAGSSYKANLSQLAPLFTTPQVLVTGGTYNNSTGAATFTNSTGGTFSVTGFTTGTTSGAEIFVTGGTYNNSTGTATFRNTTGGTFNVTGFTTGGTEVFVTGGTVNSTGGTATFTNTTGGTFTITGMTTPFSGGSGNCINNLYVNNVYACSNEITVFNRVQSTGSDAQNTLSFAWGLTNVASGNYSFAFGTGTTASGIASHAEGIDTLAIGNFSHAEGNVTRAGGEGSHSEGYSTNASGDYSHAEGFSTAASAGFSHSQNKSTLARGGSSHAGGNQTITDGPNSFVHGFINYVGGESTAILGGQYNTVFSGSTNNSGIFGGEYNIISGLTLSDFAQNSVIIGGSGNTITYPNSSIIASEGSRIDTNYSVILGGSNITGTALNTVYVPNLVIYPTTTYTPTGTTDNTVGEVGSVTWDNNYFYYRDNIGWKRISGATW
jgi:hypothetical protein